MLASTLRRHGGEHYGRVVRDKPSIATPFSKGAPIEGAEFENPYETINYTCQAYLHAGQGVNHEEAKYAVNELISKAFIAARLDNMDSSLTAAGLLLRQLLPAAYRDQDLNVLSHEQEEVAAALVKELSDNPFKTLWYVKSMVVPLVALSAQQLSSNAHSFVSMFRTVQGFTGTPWNHRAFPKAISFVPDAQSEVESYRLLFTPERTQVAVTQEPSVAGVFSVMRARDNFGNFCAIVDAGALFRGMQGSDVARQIRDHLKRLKPSLRGVRYFDDIQRTLMLLPSDSNEPIALADSSIETLKKHGYNLEELFTYYDQSRSTGADVPQPGSACAVVTVGTVTLMRDVLQGCARMRAWTDRQSCVLVSTREVLPTTVDADSIYLHGMANQAHELGLDKISAARQRILAAVTDLWRKHGHYAPTARRNALWKLFREVIVTENRDNPMEDFGPAQETPTSMVLANYCQTTAARVKKLYLAASEVPGADTPALLENLRQVYVLLRSGKWQNLVGDMGMLPATIRGNALSTRQNQHQQTQRQMQVDTQNLSLDEANAVRSKKVVTPTGAPSLLEPEWEFSLNFLSAMIVGRGDLVDDDIYLSNDFIFSFEGQTGELGSFEQKPTYYMLRARDGENAPLTYVVSLMDANSLIAEFDRLPNGENPHREAVLLDRTGQVVRATRFAQPLTDPDEACRAALNIKLIEALRTKSWRLTSAERAMARTWASSPERAAVVRTLKDSAA